MYMFVQGTSWFIHIEHTKSGKKTEKILGSEILHKNNSHHEEHKIKILYI